MVAPLSLRLSAGELKGRRVEVPPGVRPTEARVREALFSIWHGRVAGCRFLDLFAGSGAVGLEAFSRGAGHVCFVEQARRALTALAGNCRDLEVDAEIVRGSLPRALEARQGPSGRFDLLFADPPYAFTGYEPLIAAAARRARPEGELAVEHSARVETVDEVAGWICRDRRQYGESCLSFYQATDRL